MKKVKSAINLGFFIQHIISEGAWAEANCLTSCVTHCVCVCVSFHFQKGLKCNSWTETIRCWNNAVFHHVCDEFIRFYKCLYNTLKSLTVYSQNVCGLFLFFTDLHLYKIFYINKLLHCSIRLIVLIMTFSFPFPCSTLIQNILYKYYIILLYLFLFLFLLTSI